MLHTNSSAHQHTAIHVCTYHHALRELRLMLLRYGGGDAIVVLVHVLGLHIVDRRPTTRGAHCVLLWYKSSYDAALLCAYTSTLVWNRVCARICVCVCVCVRMCEHQCSVCVRGGTQRFEDKGPSAHSVTGHVCASIICCCPLLIHTQRPTFTLNFDK